MSIYSNDNIRKIAKLTTRELPQKSKNAEITVRENNGLYSSTLQMSCAFTWKSNKVGHLGKIFLTPKSLEITFSNRLTFPACWWWNVSWRGAGPMQLGGGADVCTHPVGGDDGVCRHPGDEGRGAGGGGGRHLELVELVYNTWIWNDKGHAHFDRGWQVGFKCMASVWNALKG